MHKLTKYENILDMLEHEIDEIEKNGIKTKEDACTLNYLLASVDHATNHINYLKMKKAIEEDIEQGQQMYSERGNSNGNSNRYPYNSYNSYKTYQNRMNSNAGGNSNDFNSYGNSRVYNRYSRDEGKRKMVTKLNTLMDDTMSDQEREAILDCIDRIERN